MKAAVYVCLGLSVLICMCWPFAVYLSIFAFDAPFRSWVDEIARVSGVLLFLAYPWGLLVGVAHFIKESKKQSWKPSRTCALLLAPYLHLAIFFAPMSIIWK